MKKIYTLFSLLMFSCLYAQTTGSNIDGKITNENGEPLAGASIIATHEPTGSTFNATSLDGGFFNITNVIPGGPYTLIISEMESQERTIANINIDLGETFSVNISLSQGTMLSEVIVSENRSNSKGASTSIKSDKVKSIPTITRNITDITRLVPQSNGNSAFAGASNRFNNYMVDGAAYNNNFGLGSAQFGGENPLSIEVFDQVQVDLSPVDMALSGFTGAAVNATTKSGSNIYKAEAYSYIQNDQMIGNDPGIGKNVLRGVTFSGPILKDKIFFFANYEEYNYLLPAFSYGPSADGVGNGVTTSRVLESELINIQTQMKNLYDYEPGLYGDNIPFANVGERLNLRLDWNINSKQKFFIRYNNFEGKEDITQSSNSVRGIYRYRSTRRHGGDLEAVPFQNNQYINSRNVESLSAELRSNFIENTTNVLRVTYTNITDPERTIPGGQDFPMLEILEPVDGEDLYYTAMGNELYSIGNKLDNNIFTLTNDFTLFKGKHNYKFGLRYESQSFKNAFNPVFNGLYRFSSLQNFKDVVIDKVPGAYPYAFAIGYALDGTLNPPMDETEYRNFAVYAQDNIKVNDKLELTAGARLEFASFPIDIVENTAISALNKTFTFNGKSFSPDIREFPEPAPALSIRAGGIYDIKGDGKYLLRFSTGINTGFIPFVWVSNQPSTSGVLRNFTGYDQSDMDLADFQAVMDNFAGGTYQFDPDTNFGRPDGPSPQTLGGGYGDLVLTDKDFKMPKNWRTSITLDAKLPFGIFGSANFLYTKFIESPVVNDIILNDAQVTMNGPDQRGYWTARESDPDYSNVYYLTNLQNDLPQAYSLTLSAEKDFNNGFTASVAYTTGKAEDNGGFEGSTAFSSWPGTVAYNRNRPEIGFAQWDVPNRVVGTLTYQKGGSTILLLYRGQEAGRYSYTYSGHFGDRANRLIYIPNNASELNFVDNGGFTAAEQTAAFDRFIDQDDYLSKNRGKIAERYGAVLPYVGRFDLKLIQSFDMPTIAGQTNKIEISLDIINIGNLANSRHGVFQTANQRNPLRFQGLNDNNEPTYSMNAVRNSLDYSSYRDGSGVFNTWQMQLGVRYKFN
mgnify:FL=1|tara:strand:- start:14 stop:3253 length:3240 start_codon:yes stop_codon:yes gene_type:complete